MPVIDLRIGNLVVISCLHLRRSRLYDHYEGFRWTIRYRGTLNPICDQLRFMLCFEASTSNSPECIQKTSVILSLCPCAWIRDETHVVSSHRYTAESRFMQSEAGDMKCTFHATSYIETELCRTQT